MLQRFQSEEHLIIHRRKHEMTLKFPAIKTDAAFTGEAALTKHQVVSKSKILTCSSAMTLKKSLVSPL